jgi:hypothetical protein
MHEHRSYFRWQINWQAQVMLPKKEELTKCYIRDINFKGLQISLGKRLKKDAFVNLTLVFSPEFTFDIEAWVVWQGTIEGLYTYGLLFTKIQDSDKEALYNFIYNNFSGQITNQWWQGVPIKEGGESMEDRRIFERFSTRFPLRFLSAVGNKEGQALTQDISAKGIGFVTNEELIPHTDLELWLEVPDKGEPIYARGQVAWSRMVDPANFRAGVELEKADFMGISRVLRAIENK